MNVAQQIINYLEKIGVKHIFTVVGGGAIFLNDAIRQSNIQPIFCLHEQAAAIAAEAYAQAGGIGVVLVTTGPGVTNSLTGVAGAYLESTPVLIISGQVNTFHSNTPDGPRQIGFQEVNTKSLVTPIVKTYSKLTSGNDAEEKLHKLLAEMKKGRPGPVWFDIPLDIQNAEVEGDIQISKTKKYQYNQTTIYEGIAKNHILNSLNKAKRPVCLLGNGVRLAGVEKEVIEFLRVNNIPTLCTWKTFDMFTEDDPIYFGRPGIVASRYANKIQQESDLILCLGARMDLGQVAFSYENFAPHSHKIIIDVSNEELKKWDGIDNVCTYCCDLSFFSSASSNYLKKSKSWSWWLEHCLSLKKKYNLDKERECNSIDKDHLYNYTFYNMLPVLAKYITNHDVIVHGSSGSCSEMTCQALKLYNKTRVIGTHGLGSMGFGVPAAIGAYFATHKHIICIEGDGSLAMNMQELELIHRYSLPINIFVINNNGYASIRNTQDKFFDGNWFGSSPSVGLTLPNYQNIAKAFNLSYVSVSKPNELKSILQHHKWPTIIELYVDMFKVRSYPRTFTKMVDGKITTMPMDQLWPERE